jgi:hypothetical protein
MWAYAIGGLVLAAVVALGKRPAFGHGATDVLPSKWTGPPAMKKNVKGRSGRTYLVMGWPPVGGEDYFVAQPPADPNVFVSWVHDRTTHRRELFRAAAKSPAERDAMMADFDVQKAFYA